MKDNILVSICCETYNHEKYIEQTIEGFLKQKTNFNFEILIHDDASTDNTVNIIKEYKKKHPEIIIPIYQTENQYSKKEIHIWLDLQFKRAKGKYIALCEGDDYWTDPLKLQKQVDFLENNLEFSTVFHQVRVWENNIVTDKIFPSVKKVKDVSTIEDLSQNNYIPTLSVVFKNPVVYPDYFKKSFIGDYPIHLYNAEKGKIKFIPEVMGVYRKGVGIWSTNADLLRDKRMLQSLFIISNHYKENPTVHDNLFKQQKYYFYSYLIKSVKEGKSALTVLCKDKIFNNISLKYKIFFFVKFLLKKKL